jgi:CHAT domain-containing protein
METFKIMEFTFECASMCFSPLGQVAVRVALVILLSATSVANADQEMIRGVDQAARDCGNGYYHLAIDRLRTSFETASDLALKARAAAALGRAYLRINNTELGTEYLQKALEHTQEPLDRAKLAIDLGNVYLGLKRWREADKAYDQALAEAPVEDIAVHLSVEINRSRKLPPTQRLVSLAQAVSKVSNQLTQRDRARFLLNIGFQALEIQLDGKELAYRSFSAASTIASTLGDDQLLAEAYDGLSDLYELDGRSAEARLLVEKALLHVRNTTASPLLIALEWRLARLLKAQGEDSLALSAFRRAVQHIEQSRADIPITYQNGQSSFRETLEPIYQGLTDLLIKQAVAGDVRQRQSLLREAINTVELVKQTELQDYLRDRCSVGTLTSEKKLTIPPATAIYYPIILPDRLELLVETASGINQQTVAVRRDELQNTARDFTRALRSLDKRFDVVARKLHGWLFKPIQTVLEVGEISSIVVVPDGVLRLIPFGALLDGDQFVIERFAISTSPGLSAMRESTAKRSGTRFLLAGLSRPGTVVEKLPLPMVSALLAPSSSRSLAPASRSRAISRGNDESRTIQGADEGNDNDNLRTLLALEGVKKEIEDIGAIVSAKDPLLDETFTLQRLEHDISDGSYRTIHIASHGFFGDSAENSFILTFDELLHIDNLKTLLRTRKNGGAIDLITLSACQTAEGDDRAPLGFSGVAIKAGAKSAIGTLWPVADDAATILMPQFYRNLASGKFSKRDALRMAQLVFINNAKLKRQFGHPYFWAPFILVGGWQ